MKYFMLILLIIYLGLCVYLGLNPKIFDDNINNIVMSIRTMI
jgi:hypothetical protein